MTTKPFHEITLQVPFHDLDPLQLVWHGNYLKYFECARDALLEHLGIDLTLSTTDAGIVFPVIRTSTKHIYPLRYRDIFICKAEIREAQFKIVINYEVRLANNNKRCATGTSEQVAIKLPEMELQPMIPKEIQEKLIP